MRQIGQVPGALIVLIAVMAVGTVAHGDLASISIQQTRLTTPAPKPAPEQHSGSLNLLSDLNSLRYSAHGMTAASPEDDDAPPKNIHVLSDSHSSLTMCMSALVGLGFYCSVHRMRKFSITAVPEWYHSGGPIQIGHSLAINPENICPTPVCIFEQPVVVTEKPMPDFRRMVVASLWRESQFTSEVLTSRGPPLAC